MVFDGKINELERSTKESPKQVHKDKPWRILSYGRWAFKSNKILVRKLLITYLVQIDTGNYSHTVIVYDTFNEILSISLCRLRVCTVLNTRYPCIIKSRYKSRYHYFEIMLQNGIFVWKIPRVGKYNKRQLLVSSYGSVKKRYEKNYAIICLVFLVVFTKNRNQNRWNLDGHK